MRLLTAVVCERYASARGRMVYSRSDKQIAAGTLSIRYGKAHDWREVRSFASTWRCKLKLDRNHNLIALVFSRSKIPKYGELSQQFRRSPILGRHVRFQILSQSVILTRLFYLWGTRGAFEAGRTSQWPGTTWYATTGPTNG
jgi:hypothetical protein